MAPKLSCVVLEIFSHVRSYDALASKSCITLEIGKMDLDSDLVLSLIWFVKKKVFGSTYSLILS